MIRLPAWRGDGARGAFVAAMAEWVYSRALTDLVGHFGGGPVPTTLPAALRYLDEFSARVWDFRRGRERHHSDAPDFDAGTATLVHDRATTLGLIRHDTPDLPRYDFTLVLGARVRACLLRAHFAAEILGAGVQVGHVVGLGSLRPVEDEEGRHAAEFGITPAASEFDVLDAALRRAFPLSTSDTRVGGEPADHPRTGWRIRDYDGPPPTQVLAAPSSEPAHRRANTADTVTFWADTAGVGAAHQVLLVTSSLHATFQHCDAIRVLGLPRGCTIETVGLDPATAPDERLRLPWQPATLLQEIRSAIRSLRHLHDTLTARPHTTTAS